MWFIAAISFIASLPSSCPWEVTVYFTRGECGVERKPFKRNDLTYNKMEVRSFALFVHCNVQPSYVVYVHTYAWVEDLIHTQVAFLQMKKIPGAELREIVALCVSLVMP